MIDRENAIENLEQNIRWIEEIECHKFPGWLNVTMAMRDALELLKEQKSEWLEDSDPGQVYETTWACAECGCSIHEHTVWNPYRARFKYCPFCGDRMVLKRDD